MHYQIDVEVWPTGGGLAITQVHRGEQLPSLSLHLPESTIDPITRWQAILRGRADPMTPPGEDGPQLIYVCYSPETVEVTFELDSINQCDPDLHLTWSLSRRRWRRRIRAALREYQATLQ